MKKINTTWRAFDITVGSDVCKEYGFWEVFWGTDIFINDVPFLKTLVLANILVWIALWLGGRDEEDTVGRFHVAQYEE